MDDLENWIEEGYVNTAVWKALQRFVSADVLPTLPKKPRLDEATSSSDQLLSNSESAERANTPGFSASFEAEDVTGRKTFLNSTLLQTRNLHCISKLLSPEINTRMYNLTSVPVSHDKGRKIFVR